MEKSQFPETSKKFSKASKNGSLEKQVSFFQDLLPPEGGPPARNPFKIQETGPLEKTGVVFFRFFAPRREEP